MAYRRPQDEWSVVVQKQAELNRQLEEEELARSWADKHSLKRDLLFQQKLLEQQKEADRKVRQQEAQEVRFKMNIFQNQDCRGVKKRNN